MSCHILKQLDEMKRGPDEGTVSRAAMVDLAHECAEEIRRLRRKANRLLDKENEHD